MLEEGDMLMTKTNEITRDLLGHLGEIRTLTVSQIAFCYEVSPQIATAALQGLTRKGVLVVERINHCDVYKVQSRVVARSL